MSDTSFAYGLFKDTGIELNRRFKRYFFARIDEFIAVNTNVDMKYSVEDLVNKTGPKTSFHIEHMLAYNDGNRRLFNNDEELFERERNRLGDLLLLKGKDNISSNNESYSQKLKSYANTLIGTKPCGKMHTNPKGFLNMIATLALNFHAMPSFGPDELGERHKLLFDLAAIIRE